MEILKPIKEFSTYPKSYTLIDKDNPRINVRNLFKYMDLDTALKCLRNSSIRLVQPSEWPDKYERHFYDADYSALTNDPNDTPRVWACCFTTSAMSEASWNTYRYGKQGLGSKCVKFQLSRRKFRESLRKDKRIRSTFEGFMDYSLTDYEIQHIHLKSSKHYRNIFSLPFTKDTFLSLLLLKRAAFNYENEFRFLCTLEENIEEKEIYIPIDWSAIIERIEVDKDMTEMELDVLNTYLKIAKVPDEIIGSITKSKLYDDPAGKIKIEI